MKKISSGKVREIYEVDDDKLMMVVSDRISAFDFIMPNPVLDKGKIKADGDLKTLLKQTATKTIAEAFRKLTAKENINE